MEKGIESRLLGKGWELEKTHSVARLVAISREFKVRRGNRFFLLTCESSHNISNGSKGYSKERVDVFITYLREYHRMIEETKLDGRDF